MFYIERRLFTYVESDRRKYRYPVHYQDVAQMPEHEQIHRELRKNRDENLKLIERQLPELGNCKFADYFTAAIGPTLYQKFMADYTWKMWNIPGEELETSMVWADRFQGEKGAPPARGVSGYDPLKFEDHTLGKGVRFQVYPKHGWNAVWDAMVARSTVVRDRIVGYSGRAHSRRTCSRQAARNTTSPTTTPCSARSTSISSGARTHCPIPAG